jgi:Ca2+/Na+ antiporter
VNQEKKDIYGVAVFTAVVTGSLFLILIPVEYFNDGPPGTISKSAFFLLGFGLLSSLLSFKFPIAGRSLLRGYYVFFLLSCVVLSVSALRNTASVVAGGLLVAPILVCWSIVRELRSRRNADPESHL